LKTKQVIIHSDRCSNTCRQKCLPKGSRIEAKIQEVEHECMMLPVIIGTTGIVTIGFKKNLEAIPGKHSIDSLQKAAVPATSHIIRKVLQSEA